MSHLLFFAFYLKNSKHRLLAIRRPDFGGGFYNSIFIFPQNHGINLFYISFPETYFSSQALPQALPIILSLRAMVNLLYFLRFLA